MSDQVKKDGAVTPGSDAPKDDQLFMPQGGGGGTGAGPGIS